MQRRVTHIGTALIAALALAVAPAPPSIAVATSAVHAGAISPTDPAPLDHLSLSASTLASGFLRPIFLTARAGDADLYVVEQGGLVWALAADGSSRRLVLDLSSRVETGGGEQGLLGIAFDPADVTRLIVSYSAKGSGATTIEEYSYGLAATAANPTPVATILSVAQPAANHNGGEIAFGPDGYLWIGLGDGGGGGDTYGNAQNSHTLLGAILRLNVATLPYSIPPGNPFVDGVGGAPEVWAWGLRNPWRFTFDGNLLVIGDVGQSAREEIDILDTTSDGGANLGWNVREGNLCYPDGAACGGTGGFVYPVFEYDHSGGRCSIIGGPTYRGAGSPALAGAVLFGDFCTGEIMALRHDASGLVLESRTMLATGGLITSFGTDLNGEVYVMDTANGSVLRLAATPFTFLDVPPSAPFFSEIEWFAGRDLGTGYGDGTFLPEAPLTRQAMAAFLYRYSGSPAFTPPVTPTFNDVASDAPFYAEIEWLAASGITTGYPDGGFHPSATVSRQATAAFFYRLAGSPAFTPPDPTTFGDVGASSPFLDQIEWLAAEGVTSGFPDGGFHPGAPVSRQATAAFFSRYDALP